MESKGKRSLESMMREKPKQPDPDGACCRHCGDALVLGPRGDWCDVNQITSCEATPRDRDGDLGVHFPTATGLLYRCPCCGSHNVSEEVWQGMNTEEIEGDAGGHPMCGACDRTFERGVCEVDHVGYCYADSRPFVECRQIEVAANGEELTPAPDCGHAECLRRWAFGETEVCEQVPCLACQDEEPDPSLHEPECSYAKRFGAAGRIAP